ncbi:MAG: aldehyde dehydrogenase family protein, partial [Nitrospiraceae bacterium]
MLQGTEEHVHENTILAAWESSEPHAQRPYVRRYKRKSLHIPTCIRVQDSVITCQTEDISPGGLRVVSGVPLGLGTPLALKFSFGGNICYLNISGQVVYCLPVNQQDGLDAVGIKFSDIQEWEQIILLSLVDELIRTSPTLEKSLLTILVSRDSLADEAAQFYKPQARDVCHPDSVSPSLTLPSLSPETLPSIWPLPSEPSPLGQKSYLADKAEAVGPDLDIPTFTLLINGKDVDTGQYKYVVPVDTLLADHDIAMQALKQIKRGHVPSNYKECLYARYCVGKKDTNQAAIKAAYEASQEFRYFPLSKRFKIAADIHKLLLANKERLIELMVIEGHPLQLAEWEFFGMEQAYRKPSLDFYVRHLTRKIAVVDEEHLYWKRKPDGVVCVSPPRNAPCSSSLIAGFALLAGNTLIVKPPLQSPISTLFLWKSIVHEALRQNHAPDGTLNLIVGNSELIVDEWVNSPFVNDIIFIGDSKTGLKIGARAYEKGKKPILELSGNDMMFVWKDASLEKAVRSLLDGFLGSTQICMVPKKAFIHEDIFESFQMAFLEAVKKLKVGLPTDPGVSLSPVIKIPEYFEFLEDAMGKGADLLSGGYRINYRGVQDKDGQFIAPTVLRIKDLTMAFRMRCVQEENFFPLMPLIGVSAENPGMEKRTKDMAIFKKMVQIANTNEYGLRASAWVSSPFYINKFSEHIQNSGLLKINCRHAGFSPFLATHGGTGKTGGPYG